MRSREAQFFTRDRPENAFVADGRLIITARKVPWGNASYTSASLTTQGSFNFTYGRASTMPSSPPNSASITSVSGSVLDLTCAAFRATSGFFVIRLMDRYTRRRPGTSMAVVVSLVSTRLPGGGATAPSGTATACGAMESYLRTGGGVIPNAGSDWDDRRDRRRHSFLNNHWLRRLCGCLID